MRGSSSARALAAALLLACCAALAPAPAALAKGRVDASFGSGGSVDLGADLAKGAGLGAVAVAPAGEIFVAEEILGAFCQRLCSYGVDLRRYSADGTLVQAVVPGSTISGSTSSFLVSIDSRGRPLIAWEQGGRRVLVRRLEPEGGVDQSFGEAGTLTLPCNCHLKSLEPLPGGGVLVAAARAVGGPGKPRGSQQLIAELRPDGSGVPRFGRDGFVRIWMRGRGGAKAMPGAGGSVLLRSSACCGEEGPGVELLSRLSSRGRLERHFGLAFERSLPGIYGSRLKSYWQSTSVESRPRGGLLGFASGWVQARVFGLQEDGLLDRSFGRHGVTVLPLRYADAAPDGAGGLLVVGLRRGGYVVRRVGHQGMPDPSFGTLPLAGADNEEGLQIYPQGSGSAIVLARDLSACRQDCASDPKLFRVAW